MIAILGHGVYTPQEASKLTKLKRARIQEWLRIRGHGPFSSNGCLENGSEDASALSFLDLVDVFVAGQLREHGVSLQTLRMVHKQLGSDLATDHPFSHKGLLTHGKALFGSALTPKGKKESREALLAQQAFAKTILPFLKQIDYDKATNFALRWHITDDVVLDPKICFGKPIVQDAGIPTYILSAAFQANDRDAKRAAAWYNVTPAQVKAAVEFEKSLAA